MSRLTCATPPRFREADRVFCNQWTSVAINTTAIYDFTPAAWLYADGGVTVSSGDNSAGGGDISMSGVPTGSMSEVLPSSSVSV